MKVYIDSNNKAVTYGGKALTKGEAPSVTFTVYGDRVSIDSVTQTPTTDTVLQVNIVLTVLTDLTSSQDTLLTVSAPSGYTVTTLGGTYYINDNSGTLYQVIGTNQVNYSGSAKSTGDKLHTTATVIMRKNS